MNPSDAPWIFHAYEISYFSAKVRPALRTKGLWYRERRADLREILKRTGLAFVPVLVTPEDETWQDTSEILDRLEARHPEPSLFPRSPLQRIAAFLVELYADEFALIPAMHYRWGSELGEATARARFEAMIGDPEIARKAGDRMAGARLALGADATTAPAIEAHTRALLDALSDHFRGHPYLIGGRPSLADCALMGPVYGHFFNDLVSRRLLLETARPVVGWIERCNFPEPGSNGARTEDDALEPSLLAILSVMGRTAAPVLLAQAEQIDAWATAHPSDLDAPPRAVGRCECTLDGVPLRKVVQTYSLWMLWRTLDAFRALDPSDRRRVNAALEGTGWEPLLASRPRHRAEKRERQLVLRPEEAD